MRNSSAAYTKTQTNEPNLFDIQLVGYKIFAIPAILKYKNRKDNIVTLK